VVTHERRKVWPLLKALNQASKSRRWTMPAQGHKLHGAQKRSKIGKIHSTGSKRMFEK
jgi:hypothetical protein